MFAVIMIENSDFTTTTIEIIAILILSLFKIFKITEGFTITNLTRIMQIIINI